MSYCISYFFAQSAAVLTYTYMIYSSPFDDWFWAHTYILSYILTCGESPFPIAGFIGLAGPPGLTKLSEYPEKEWRPEARQ